MIHVLTDRPVTHGVNGHSLTPEETDDHHPEPRTGPEAAGEDPRRVCAGDQVSTIAGFSHWAPCGDPQTAWTTAVDQDGRRWNYSSGGWWVSEDGRRQRVDETYDIGREAKR